MQELLNNIAHSSYRVIQAGKTKAEVLSSMSSLCAEAADIKHKL